MARKVCTSCNTRTVGTGKGDDPQTAKAVGCCNPCYTKAGWENSHSDWGHDADSDTIVDEPSDDTDGSRVRGCWVCFPELDLTALPAVVRTGHTDTATKGPHRSHAGCKHARTSTDRAACRKANTWDDVKGWVPKA